LAYSESLVNAARATLPVTGFCLSSSVVACLRACSR
jgi:hypothetical protein